MKADAFELEIVKLTKTKKIIVSWIEIESPTGDFVVGPDHSAMVSLLKYKGTTKYKEFDGPEISIDTYGGIFKVDVNKAILLLD